MVLLTKKGIMQHTRLSRLEIRWEQNTVMIQRLHLKIEEQVLHSLKCRLCRDSCTQSCTPAQIDISIQVHLYTTVFRCHSAPHIFAWTIWDWRNWQRGIQVCGLDCVNWHAAVASAAPGASRNTVLVPIFRYDMVCALIVPLYYDRQRLAVACVAACSCHVSLCFCTSLLLCCMHVATQVLSSTLKTSGL